MSESNTSNTDQKTTSKEASVQPAPAAFDAEKSSWERAQEKLVNDKIAFVAAIVLVALYASVVFASFLSPYTEHYANRHLANSPPTPIYTLSAETGAPTWPYVYPLEKEFNAETFEFDYKLDMKKTYPIKFFYQGESYRFLGIIPTNLHLFGTDDPAGVHLLGVDINGRDIFSRMLFGGQVSLTIGFLGLFIAFPIGLVYGGLSGYIGGRTDNLMMRLAEIIMSVPTLYLLIGLAAIIPAGLSSTARFGMVVVILAFIGWAPFSRVIRGMVLAIKQQEFVEAGRSIGMGTLPIIIRHILPQTASYVLVALTLSVPGYILAESGLSFLGLGIQQPDASWGNMLKEAQDINNLINRPMMMMPGFMIFLAVLAFNVIGDSVRDILDPKSYVRK